jgi:pantetheine-phosphate adenylyltransferase
MKNVGLYPGTFDPITFGHIDIIRSSLKIVDKLILAVSNDHSKDYLFDADERVMLIKKSLFQDLNFNSKKIKILAFNSLTTSLCVKNKANIIFRGLRAVSDFEYEFQLAGMNKKLNKKIQTVFLMSDPDKQVISSKFVKEIAKLNGKIENFVTKSVKKEINIKYD